MKDYYYILGIKEIASTEEIKKAYRKLSLKFHPDKNDGDEFFIERFREIQEAYEILSNSTKRINYDRSKNITYHNNGTNFLPEIEYFRANKNAFEYDTEVTFSWKTINADFVYLKPFGKVPPIGEKTYKIKDFKNSSLSFDLLAENSNINRKINSSLILSNKTYSDLSSHFREKFNRESKKKNEPNKNIDGNIDFSITSGQFKAIIIIGLIIIFAIIKYRF